MRTKLVEETLARLRASFPLESRVEAAPEEIRRAYAEVLRFWCDRGLAPSDDVIPKEAANCLVALDAIVTGPSGFGCYPFSADTTGITVSWDGHEAAAMCAIDAAWVPRLVARPVHVVARCAQCAKPQERTIDTRKADDGEDAPRVRCGFGHLPAATSCSASLCRELVFVCAACADMEEDLTLSEAASVAAGFFAFQESLLAGHIR